MLIHLQVILLAQDSSKVLFYLYWNLNFMIWNTISQVKSLYFKRTLTFLSFFPPPPQKLLLKVFISLLLFKTAKYSHSDSSGSSQLVYKQKMFANSKTTLKVLPTLSSVVPLRFSHPASHRSDLWLHMCQTQRQQS